MADKVLQSTEEEASLKTTAINYIKRVEAFSHKSPGRSRAGAPRSPGSLEIMSALQGVTRRLDAILEVPPTKKKCVSAPQTRTPSLKLSVPDP